MVTIFNMVAANKLHILQSSQMLYSFIEV